MKKIIVVSLFSALILSGCASPLMSPVENADNAIPKDKAVITFFRTSSFGGAIQAPIAKEKSEEEVDFVGVASTGTKIRQVVEPGEHLYVVSGESADLLKANVEPNKAYYVRIEPRMGVWKARFIHNVIHSDEVNKDAIKSEVGGAKLVDVNANGAEWFASKKGEMIKKLQKAKLLFLEKDDDYRKSRTMNPEDGTNTLY